MKYIYKNEELDDFFDNILPFNMKRKLKELVKKHVNVKKLISEFDAIIALKTVIPLYKEKIANKKYVSVLKVRVPDPIAKRGKSSGFRFVAIRDEVNQITFILDIFPKKGPKRKDNLTSKEAKKLKSLFLEYVEVLKND